MIFKTKTAEAAICVNLFLRIHGLTEMLFHKKAEIVS